MFGKKKSKIPLEEKYKYCSQCGGKNSWSKVSINLWDTVTGIQKTRWVYSCPRGHQDHHFYDERGRFNDAPPPYYPDVCDDA